MKKQVDDIKIAWQCVLKRDSGTLLGGIFDKVAPGLDKGWAIPLLMVNAQWGYKKAFDFEGFL